MKTKSFSDYLKIRFTDEEINEIERKAQPEVDIFRSIQKVLTDITVPKDTFKETAKK